MRNAWHFYYALSFVIKLVCGYIGIALAHPLTRRYIFSCDSLLINRK
ncbi:DUF3265 domain-containing protein [Vibrio parahaemolyticus]|nr:DUF3265 domain-containing protein [Vibrio parahaemolyticus]ELA7314475.1 DUF3265 domain-containing protein [Vibrio alginolyticus]NNN52798.1 DUF3265 domain-containing protein [Vibrio sp. 2-2(7)]NNN87441.1 DUF3265 domain-containing protein [Vibrio sp. 2-2(9)]ELB2835219.1 DUF3265 domain-containing protein [Vibrio alginolyticus]